MYKPFEMELELMSGEKQLFKGQQEKGLAWLEIPGLTPKTTVYQIWHVPTGLHMGVRYKNKTQAVKFIKAMREITDWEKIQKGDITGAMYDQFKEIKERILK